jgi:hypothetical protein
MGEPAARAGWKGGKDRPGFVDRRDKRRRRSIGHRDAATGLDALETRRRVANLDAVDGNRSDSAPSYGPESMQRCFRDLRMASH